MICLDANAFYWYYGRDKLPLPESVAKFDTNKAIAFIEAAGQKSIVASAFMEMIVHFRDNPETIKKIMLFREEKHLQIYNNLREYCFTPDELSLYHLFDNNACKQYAYKLLNVKIDIETKFSVVFLQTVSLLYAKYYMDLSSAFNAATKESVLSFLGRNIFSELQTEYTVELKKSLECGYNDRNRSQQYLKQTYIESLTQNCVIAHVIIDTLKKIDEENDLYPVMCSAASEAKNNGLNNIDTMRTIVNTLNTNTTFLQYAKSEIANIFHKKGFTLHQSKYVECMLNAWLDRGQQLRKNDIFDMMCMAVLDHAVNKPKQSVLIDTNMYLITFDDAMVNFIKEAREFNFNKIDQFYFH